MNEVVKVQVVLLLLELSLVVKLRVLFSFSTPQSRTRKEYKNLCATLLHLRGLPVACTVSIKQNTNVCFLSILDPHSESK